MITGTNDARLSMRNLICHRVCVTMILASIGIVTGCESASDDGVIVQQVSADIAEISHEELNPKPVRTQVVFESDSLTIPHRLADTPAGLVVLNPYTDPKILLVNVSNGSLIDSFGRAGGGPGEFRFPYSISSISNKPDIVWIGDPNQHRITRLTVDGSAGIVRDAMEFIAPFREIIFSEVVALNDSLFLTNGAFVTARFRLFAKSGHLVDEFGPSPNPERGEPVAIAAMAQEETFAIHPDRRYVAAGGMMNGFIRLYDLERPEWSKIAETPFPFQPTYRAGSRGSLPSLQPQANTRYGYLGLAATRDRIYALFSGRTLGGFGQASGTGRFIHVFDWEGRLIEVLTLPEAVAAITVAREGTSLYATRWEPYPAVVRIMLSADSNAS